MEDVLEVARMDNGGERAEPREVELATLARRVVAGVRADRPRAVTVEVIHDTVRTTDPRRLDRVLTNLVTNALRHGAEPVVEADGPELRVRDHGPGFPPDLIARGPQRFRRRQRRPRPGPGHRHRAGRSDRGPPELAQPARGRAVATVTLPLRPRHPRAHGEAERRVVGTVRAGVCEPDHMSGVHSEGGASVFIEGVGACGGKGQH